MIKRIKNNKNLAKKIAVLAVLPFIAWPFAIIYFLVKAHKEIKNSIEVVNNEFMESLEQVNLGLIEVEGL